MSPMGYALYPSSSHKSSYSSSSHPSNFSFFHTFCRRQAPSPISRPSTTSSTHTDATTTTIPSPQSTPSSLTNSTYVLNNTASNASSTSPSTRRTSTFKDFFHLFLNHTLHPSPPSSSQPLPPVISATNTNSTVTDTSTESIPALTSPPFLPVSTIMHPTTSLTSPSIPNHKHHVLPPLPLEAECIYLIPERLFHSTSPSSCSNPISSTPSPSPQPTSPSFSSTYPVSISPSTSRPTSPLTTEKYKLVADRKKKASCLGKGATAVVKLARVMEDHSELQYNQSHGTKASPCHSHLKSSGPNSTGKLYAIKEFRRRRKNESEKDYIKKLAAEFCISSSLHHINVVETIDLIQNERQHWCEIMEYCSGGDLFSAIKAGHMSPSEMDCCFKQLIHGVQYLHANGVAHRDLKPENLLFDAHGHLKITDFGVSEVFQMCWESTPHLSQGVYGSEPYIAPEAFLGQFYDARELDLWACGVIYYAMRHQGIPWRHAALDDPNYVHYLSLRGLHAFDGINTLGEGPATLMYQMLDPNPKTRATMKDVLKNPWINSIKVCHEECYSPTSFSTLMDPSKPTTTFLSTSTSTLPSLLVYSN